jgi:hypothetical protein
MCYTAHQKAFECAAGLWTINDAVLSDGVFAGAVPKPLCRLPGRWYSISEVMPVFLYHYFEKAKGPFLTVSELPYEEALNVLTEIQRNNPNLVNPHKEWFIKRRYEMEALVREKFISKGGKPTR